MTPEQSKGLNSIVETVAVKTDAPDNPQGFYLVNKDDFDPANMKLFQPPGAPAAIDASASSADASAAAAAASGAAAAVAAEALSKISTTAAPAPAAPTTP